MESNLNFRPERFGQYGGSQRPGEDEEVIVRDRTGRGRPSVAVRDHRGPGAVVRDQRGHPGGGFHGHPVGRSFGSPFRPHGLSFSPVQWRGAGGFRFRPGGGAWGGEPRGHGFFGRPGSDFRYRGFGPRWPWMGGGSGEPAGGGEPIGGPSGEPDMPGDDPQIVAWAQSCLAHLIGPWVPQDGTMGPGTARAIRMFQTQAQVNPSGTLDDDTLAALSKACEASASAAPGADSPGGVSAAPAAPQDAGAAPAGPPPTAPGGQPSELEAPDFPRELEYGESYEWEDQKNNPMLLVDSIPEVPYSNQVFQKLHQAFEVYDGVHTAMTVFGVEFAGLLGIGMEVLAPVAAFLGGIFAIVSASEEAREEISRREVRSGFIYGVAAGAAGRKWPLLKRLFWRPGPQFNAFDPGAGKIAQNSFNIGLVAGFLQGREIARNKTKQRFFWDSIIQSLSDTDRAYYLVDRSRWTDRDWIDWYITAAAHFELYYLTPLGLKPGWHA